MPRFFFTTHDSSSVDIDDEGLDFPNERAAKNAAQRALVDIADEHLPDGERADFKVEVENADHAKIYDASLRFEAREPGQTAEDNDRALDEAADRIAAALKGMR
ncbi:hypothetical protein AXW83_22950 [Bosea sp. PAMC 26642]|nr:hypothetical protein AXW83_22950 [Bosea sp. PAMC 26642]